MRFVTRTPASILPTSMMPRRWHSRWGIRTPGRFSNTIAKWSNRRMLPSIGKLLVTVRLGNRAASLPAAARPERVRAAATAGWKVEQAVPARSGRGRQRCWSATIEAAAVLPPKPVDGRSNSRPRHRPEIPPVSAPKNAPPKARSPTAANVAERVVEVSANWCLDKPNTRTTSSEKDVGRARPLRRHHRETPVKLWGAGANAESHRYSREQWTQRAKYPMPGSRSALAISELRAPRRLGSLPHAVGQHDFHAARCPAARHLAAHPQAILRDHSGRPKRVCLRDP